MLSDALAENVGPRTSHLLALTLGLAFATACGGMDEVTVSVSGVVSDSSNLMPVAGATVDVVGTAQSVQTDASGVFVVEAEPGAVIWLRAVMENGIPVRRPLLVPAEGEMNFGLDVLAQGAADGAYAALSLPARDEQKGIVAVHFLHRSESGGEGVAINLANDGSFSFDGEFMPTMTDALLPGFYEGLIFTNVVEGQVTSELRTGTNCSIVNLSEASAPVVANELTRIDYECVN